MRRQDTLVSPTSAAFKGYLSAVLVLYLLDIKTLNFFTAGWLVLIHFLSVSVIIVKRQICQIQS